MRFEKKQSKNKNFWVANYTDEERDFFIGLGFTERLSRNLDGSINREYSTLSYHGSKLFGFWSDEEVKKIHTATRKKFGKFKVRTLTLAELI